MYILTIARQYGSGGRQIGQEVARRLQIPYYDKELVALAAKKSGMSEELFQKADERHASSLLYSLAMGNYTVGLSGTAANLPLNDQLFLLQAQIIRNAAHKGPCVIVGRCADYILRSFPHILRIFLYADREKRVEQAVSEYGLDPQKAPELVAKADKQRAAYYNFYTGARWENPENYDLCLNTGSLERERTVQLIVKIAQDHPNQAEQ